MRTEVLLKALDEDSFPASPNPNVTTNKAAYMVINHKEISTAYTDLTGRFPCKSSSGKQYVLVGYHYNGNTILGQSMKNRKTETITAAWQY